MSYFQRPRAAGGGSYLQRLTKLYSDTKQSYESAKVVPDATANVNDDPEVAEQRRDFQIQQDRLLAWGMHWADVEAQFQQGQDGQDVDIDKKIDQAGLGEVVASVMNQIKSLLDESGRLQHPEKYELATKGIKGMRGTPSSPTNLRRKEWSQHEVQTGRTLLDQLTTCIDVLYSLSESRRADEKGEKSKGKADMSPDFGTKGSGKGGKGLNNSYGHVDEHPLHINFEHIDFDDSSALHQSSDPPPYNAAEVALSARDRNLGYYRGDNKPVLVDFLTSDCPPYVIATADDVFELHELGEKLSKNRSMSWNGHLRLIGFTVDPRGPRCGMVYELPTGHGHQALQQNRTLGAAIAASSNQESAQPALEDRFRLAYNLALSVLGYFSQGDCHRYVNSGNVLLINKDSSTRHLAATPPNRPYIRCPYLVQSCQDLVLRLPGAEEPFEATIYRHPAHDLNASETMVPTYDIYSLGLILLEVGLWTPLAKLWKPKYDRRIFMERVQRIYSQKLASKCGSKYMRLVQRCLHAPAELLGKNKPEEAAAHLLEVVKELRFCCALDEEGMPPVSDIECFELLIIEQMCKSDALEEQEKDLPPLPPRVVPGAFLNEQETGVTRSGSTAVKRKPLPETITTPQSVTMPTKKKENAPALRKWPEVQIAQPDLDQWNTLLMPRLKKILQDVLCDSEESCSVSLMKVGTSAEAAKTTICIQCSNTSKVHDALTKRFKPKKGWGVVILKGDIRRSGTKRKPRRQPRRSGGNRGQLRKPKEQKYQEKPSCGASIGAFKDFEHLPPVSFGGTILVDGEPYGMTVHHMLDTPSDEEEEDSDNDQPVRSAAQRPSASALADRMGSDAELSFMQSEDDLRHFSDLEISDDDDDDALDSDSDASTIRPDYSILDADGNEFWFLESSSPPSLDDDDGSDLDDDLSSSSSDDEDDAASVGDKIGILPFSSDCDDLAVTQPAIDDVDDDFFPNLEDRDDDHLASHTFGFVHASSGIRRVVRGELKHEVDWALIRVQKDRLEVGNPLQTVPNSRRPEQASQQQTNTPILTRVTPTHKLSSQPVSCRARSSGFSSGRISQAMSLVKLHGRHSFSDSWCVDGLTTTGSTDPRAMSKSTRSKSATAAGRLGIPGDSGAWVYNPETGELCGHILAYGEKLRQAYIAPMEVLFEDIRTRLGAQWVGLPGGIQQQRQQAEDEEDCVLVGSGNDRSSGMDTVEKRMKGLRLATPKTSVTPLSAAPPTGFSIQGTSASASGSGSGVGGNSDSIESSTTTAKAASTAAATMRKTPEVNVARLPLMAGAVS